MPEREPSSERAAGTKSVRLFAAVHLGDEVTARAVSAAKKVHRHAPDAKWAAGEGLHLTLFFFGWVSPERIGPLGDALAAAARQGSPMRLGVAGSGTFGSQKKPRVLWMGFTGEVDKLVALQAAVVGEVQRLGFEPEARAFVPHFTLARARNPHGDPGLARCRDALAKVDCGEERVDTLILYRSELSPKGARYTVYQAYPLGTPEGPRSGGPAAVDQD